MPMVSISAPPASGPSIRVRLAVALSRAMAVPNRDGPARSPSMVRRTGKSSAQMTPLQKTPAAT